jgi:hypothetical protein
MGFWVGHSTAATIRYTHVASMSLPLLPWFLVFG